MRDHGARVLDPAAQHHDRRHGDHGCEQVGDRLAGEDAREEPTEEREPADADQ